MIVSFDLDDTLFVSDSNFKTEPPLNFPMCIIYKERLRAVTVALMNYIRSQNITLWIYTTSYSSERYIRGLFRSYGIRLDNVINGEKNAKEVQADRADGMPSKYPSKYRIDLHIGDDTSMLQNGKIYGFNDFLAGDQDDDWVEKIKTEIDRIKSRSY